MSEFERDASTERDLKRDEYEIGGDMSDEEMAELAARVKEISRLNDERRKSM